ncbi:type II toxin-antitoxin system Phd/YefM family antitoxin [Crocosphaera sp. XPORK-15E]|uniref:type II toxin-antitoxin system Phd/YefM family antitoxin n=1 Tax=Crocosphaera sp. XPORK-15E TaxID=3110247 RepID=UPI002B214FA4|nr:type II toxin-antitoxin system Phd/YefM family antitoxin [Crocosphaera sp. XPORK-15E]MEA5536611.1 type II toxin-antitoxin system Phd/YefM family antitoxin [Crocosphaera sp. XPORK-15E]
MESINIHHAKTHLSKLLQRVALGEEIIIASRGIPVAKLVPFNDEDKPRPLGIDRGKFTVPDDFNAPLPDEILNSFYGEEL